MFNIPNAAINYDLTTKYFYDFSGPRLGMKFCNSCVVLNKWILQWTNDNCNLIERKREEQWEKKKTVEVRFRPFVAALRRGCKRLFIAGIIMGFCPFETIFTARPCSRAYERTTSLQLRAWRVFMVRAALLVRLKLYWPELAASFTAVRRP